MTTKPFLYLELVKGSWKEELHPRDTYGKFSTVKGGSKVVTKTGKTGVVEGVDNTHYTVRYEDGKKGKVAKDNAIHANDHKKVMDAQKKKKKKRSEAGKKGVETKSRKKADGHGKAEKIDHKKVSATKQAGKKTHSTTKKAPTKAVTPKAETKAKANATVEKVPKLKTAKKAVAERVKTQKQKASEARKKQRAEKRAHDLEAPNYKHSATQTSEAKEVKVAVPQNTSAQRVAENKKASEEVQAVKNIENTPAPQSADMSADWDSAQVKRILAKPANKRSEEEIRKVAGAMTDKNDKLAYYVVHKMAKARGLNIYGHVNRIGNKATPSDRVVTQETGIYGDMLQSARGAMYETLHNVLSGSQKPNTNIARHVVGRMKQAVHKDLYGLMNSLPAPHEIRNAIADVHKGETELAQTLGRTPSHEELAQHLEDNSKHFKNAPIVLPPEYDNETGKWKSNQQTRIKDPAERLKTLKRYMAQQKAVSGNAPTEGTDGSHEVQDTFQNEETPSIEDAYERKERNKELKTAIPKALADMGLTDTERKVYMYMYGSHPLKPNAVNLSAKETMEAINADGGHNGEPVKRSWVERNVASARNKLMSAFKSNHPAIESLRMLKSLFFNIMMKSLYEYDLVKSLHSWGIGTDALVQRVIRKEVTTSKIALQKSLQAHEYIGSYVVTDDGTMVANIVVFDVAPKNELYKSFQNHLLQKSMFPHKGGSNHTINQKASEYVKANSGKYKALQDQQHTRLKGKTGNLTWSEQLQQEKGGVWITWGGKKILINGESGEILYDSKNDTHRDEHNNGASEDQIDFHHEADAMQEHEDNAEKNAYEAVEASKASKKQKGVVTQADMQRHRLTKNEDGTYSFGRHEKVDESNRHLIDHGIQAFNEQMDEMNNQHANNVAQMKKDIGHKSTQLYADMSEEERAEFDGMDKDGRAEYAGKKMLEREGVKERIEKFREDAKGKSPKEQVELTKELQADLNKLTNNDYGAFKNTAKFRGKKGDAEDKGKVLGTAKAIIDGADDEKIAKLIGAHEIELGGTEAGKNHIPEGHYLIGNPRTGKTMAIRIDHGFEGGRGGMGNKIASVVGEAFDPEGGNHEQITSWGQLGRILGYKNPNGNTVNLKDLIVSPTKEGQHAKPLLKKIDEDEYKKMRSKTKLGLQESMTHKEFQLVDQGADGSKTYAQEMADGSQNAIEVGADGYIKDPIMSRLLKQRSPVNNEEELHELLRNSVGNRAWVTAHIGSNIHIGDAVGHHVQIEYDGQGAPKVVGGKYDGYRFADSSDYPKGATDPATGEPVKTLFKNGKLVDRKYTKSNNVPMEAGNSVMYPTGGGKYKKGRIHSTDGDTYKITDGKGHVVGMFKKGELKPAKEQGRMLSEAGTASVKLGKTGTHRLTVDEAFKPTGEGKRAIAKAEKEKAKFIEALKKAGINRGAFDHEGNLHDLELSDPMMKKLQKVLGRSKTGKEALNKFKSTYMKHLEIHVPEHLRSTVEAEGVTVRKDGTAQLSVAKFEQLRDALNNEGSGLSLHHSAQEYLAGHFANKDRVQKPMEQLKAEYQTFNMPDSDLATHYKNQFKDSSYLAQEWLHCPKEDITPDGNGGYHDGKGKRVDKDGFYLNDDDSKKAGGLYSTQLQGLAHLVERGRALAGHGINCTLAMTNVA